MSAAYRPPCDEGVVRSWPALAPCDQQTGRLAVAATILGTSMAFIDGTVVNVALPALQRDLKATAADVQWVVEAYALLLSALLLTGGSLGDRLGRRRIFGGGIARASIASGVAPTPLSLIAARAVQGIGAALLVPGSLTIISLSGDDRSGPGHGGERRAFDDGGDGRGQQQPQRNRLGHQ
jgi:MFS family permease